MRRVIRHVDMLPLLDIILVVLFVFATIEEGSRSGESEQLQSKVQQLLAELQNIEQQSDQNSAQRDAAEREAEQLRERNQQLEQNAAQVEEDRRQIADLQQQLRARINAEFESEAQYRVNDLLKALLKQNAVVEIELSDGNHCCFRQDAAGPWRYCGVMPASVDDRLYWLRGQSALLEALQDTKGGNAITVVRNNPGTIYEAARRLEGTIRSVVPEQKNVYSDPVSVLSAACQPE